MNKVFLFSIALLIFQKSFCQKNISIEALSGIGINKELLLVNKKINNYNSFIFRLNTSYRFKIYEEFFTETGIGAQWHFSSGNIKASEFNSTSLRIGIPIIIGRTLFEKASAALGVAISNNKDFDKFDFKSDYNLRTSFLLKGNYSIKNNLDIILVVQKNLSDVPDLYLLNQPNVDISFGVFYKLL